MRNRLVRLRFLQSEIEILRNNLHYVESSRTIPDEIKYIKSPNFSDVGSKNSSSSGSITEDAGIKLAQKSCRLKNNLLEKEREYNNTRALLLVLDDKEKFIIEKYYLEGNSLSAILKKFLQTFQENICESTAKRKRLSALQKMSELLTICD